MTTSFKPSTEQWRPIPGWEGYYEVSDHGRVRSLERTVVRKNGVLHRQRGRVMKPCTTRNSSGHESVGLRRAGEARHFWIHRLVLTAFVGEAPVGAEACHNDGDPTNNRLDNLRWDSHRENMLDIGRHGRDHNANKNHCPHGHPYDTGNTMFKKNGGRQCRTCHKAANARWRAGRRVKKENAA